MSQGWIKLHRSIMDNKIFKNANLYKLWTTLLFMASHKRTEFYFNGKVNVLEPGQILTGRKKLSEATGLKPTTIERSLRTLISGQQITQKTTNKNRVITIVNWDKYQNQNESGQQVDNKRTTNGHIQEGKECKEERHTAKEMCDVVKKPLITSKTEQPVVFERFWAAYPRKVGKQAAERAWARIEPSPEFADKLLTALELQKQQPGWLEDNGQFIPHASSWLNGGRWTDEVILPEPDGPAPERVVTPEYTKMVEQEREQSDRRREQRGH